MTNIYVLSKNGQPLMPVHSNARARRLLKNGKAHIVNYVPFTIQLTYDPDNPSVDECLLGMDPGRTNIGLCAIDSKGNVLFASDVQTRNKAIAKLMLARKRYRQVSRRGERLRRQRRAIASDKTGMARHTEYWRLLSGYEEPVCCKVIRNSKARFNNRTRPEGWLTPTARHLLTTHMNLVHKVTGFLPVAGIVVEINKFDFQRMENPGIRNWEHQKGRLSGFKDVNDAVWHRQESRCLLCGRNGIEHYHHLVPVHTGGSDTLDNKVGLCKGCHNKVHTSPEAKIRLSEKATGLKKKYHALSVVNRIIKLLLEGCAGIKPTYVTTGMETKCLRELYGLEKDHYTDAWCIAVSALDAEPEAPEFKGSVHGIRQFRRHDRALIKSQRERTYYLDGKAVAKNRKPRFEQEGPALSDLRLTEAEVSRLTVTKSTRYYNSRNRLMPGAVFLYNGKRHVMSGQLSGGKYIRAVGDGKTNYPARDCRITERNRGLVFIS